MSPKKAAALQILVALIFAGGMICARSIFGKDSFDENLVIAVWWIPFSLLSVAGCATCACKNKKQ